MAGQSFGAVEPRGAKGWVNNAFSGRSHAFSRREAGFSAQPGADAKQ